MHLCADNLVVVESTFWCFGEIVALHLDNRSAQSVCSACVTNYIKLKDRCGASFVALYNRGLPPAINVNNIAWGEPHLTVRKLTDGDRTVGSP
jgi:hypothetical protein